MRTFVMGDIHGAYKALIQCLERSGFNKEEDLLITLGDLADGWPYVFECVEELLKIKKRIDLKGNHDQWFKTFLETSIHPDRWSQGGLNTAISYLENAGIDPDIRPRLVMTDSGAAEIYEININPSDIPASHHYFFMHQWLYHLDDDHRLFVHAGFNKEMTLIENKRANPREFFWNRELFNQAMSANKSKAKLKFIEPFKEIYIGHTATTNWRSNDIIIPAGLILPVGEPVTIPIKADIIWNVDTGAGGRGKLTIMDIDTKEHWQSDFVDELYKGIKGR